MKQISKPANSTYFLAWSDDGTRHLGITNPDQVTSTGQSNLTFDSDPEAYLTAIKDIEITDLPPLPVEGEKVDRGVYQYGEVRLVCRQAHVRTHFTPEETPALFIVQQVGSGVLPWIAWEAVVKEDLFKTPPVEASLREYQGVTYKCIQSHTTQPGWTPPAVPALWLAQYMPQDELI